MDDAPLVQPTAHVGGLTSLTSARVPSASDCEQLNTAAVSAAPATGGPAAAIRCSDSTASSKAAVNTAFGAALTPVPVRAVGEQDEALSGAAALHDKRPSVMINAEILPRQSSTPRQGTKRRTRGMSMVLDDALTTTRLVGSPASQLRPPRSGAASEAATTAPAETPEGLAAAEIAGATAPEADLAARPPTPYYPNADEGPGQPAPPDAADGPAETPVQPAMQPSPVENQAVRTTAQLMPNGKRRSRSVGEESQPGPATRRRSGVAGTYRGGSSASGAASTGGRGGGGGSGISRYRPSYAKASAPVQAAGTGKGAPDSTQVRPAEPPDALSDAVESRCSSSTALEGCNKLLSQMWQRSTSHHILVHLAGGTPRWGPIPERCDHDARRSSAKQQGCCRGAWHCASRRPTSTLCGRIVRW